MRRSRLSVFNLVSLVGGLAFLYLPVILVIVFSFNKSKLVAVWGGWSLRWYEAFFSHSALIEAFFVTLRVALISATCAVFIGLALGVMLTRYQRRTYSSALRLAVVLPVVLPEIIIGLVMANSFALLSLTRGMLTLVIAHTTFASCFVALLVASRLRNFDVALEEAAVDLGYTPFQAFYHVTLPVITPSLVAGWILVLTLSFDDLIIASFTTGSGAVTLPIQVYSQIRLGVTPVVNVLSTIFLGTVVLLLLIFCIVNKLLEFRGKAKQNSLTTITPDW